VSTTINGDNLTVPGVASLPNLRVPGALSGQILVSDGSGNMTPQSPAAASITSGTLALGAGVDSGSVTGLGLGFTPSRVLLTMSIPAGGDVSFAVVVGDPTSDGFDFAISPLTPDANYKLHWQLI